VNKELKRDALLIGKGTLEVAASAIPIFGGPIATALTLLDSGFQTRRLEKLIDEVRARVARQGEDKLDRDFVNTERFQDILLAGFEAARRTSDAEKRKLVADILVGAARKDRIPDLEADALLNAVAALSPREVMLLRKIREKPSFRMTDFPDYGQDLLFDLKRLEAAGFISEDPQVRTLDYKGPAFDITATYDRMMRLVEAGQGANG
jgi:hypothetical protein